MNYYRELSFLKDQMGPTVRSLMEHNGAFLAGGAITSVFSSARINDFDLFFPNKKVLDQALLACPQDEKTVHTDSACSVVLDGHRVQLIKCVLRTPAEVLEGFDFTICQGGLDWNDGFIFGKDFFQHLAQRRLVFNIKAEYPICSLYRLRKFIKRGFHFSGIEAIKLGLRIQALQIDTYADLRKQLMGIDTMFLRDLTDSLKGQEQQKYDLNEFLDTLNVWLGKLDAVTGEDQTESAP